MRAQPREHARYPRTPLRFSCLLVVVFFSSLPAFPRPAFLLLEWRCVRFTMCQSVGLA
nr:MAG TPA: hypothetical protein [Caudoviricetes sp.]